MRLQQLLEYTASPERAMALCGAVMSGAGAAASAASDILMPILGVPLPVVLTAAAAAFVARAYMPEVGFAKACLLIAAWTVFGCGVAPFGQWLAQVSAGLAGATVALPPAALAGLAALGSSAPFWVPKVWPLVLAKLGLKPLDGGGGGGAAGGGGSGRNGAGGGQ